MDAYEDEKEYLVTVMETVEWEVLVAAADPEEAKWVAEEIYKEEGVVWAQDVEAVKAVEQ